MRIKNYIKNIFITALVLSLSFLVSLIFQSIFQVREHITMVFVFAVFLISLWTPGYIYGVVAAFVSMLAVNFAFTFPYFAFNFTIPVNLISAIVMIVIAILTSTLTTKIKQHEVAKAEGEKERMRATLLRAVSHDLRTPLTTIYGSSATLLEDIEERKLSEEQKSRILQGIKEDSEWLVRMVENLLSVTRIGAGMVKIIKTPTALEELIDAVIIKFKKRYPAQIVELTIPEELVIIPMDAMLIEQVVTNLLENAVKHAAGMKHLQLCVSVKDGQAIFAIEDDGCGIPEEYLGRIFSGYYESKEKPIDSQNRNAGIGLSVCDTIIKAHGGAIRAENKSTGGMRFSFVLDTEEVSHEQ